MLRSCENIDKKTINKSVFAGRCFGLKDCRKFSECDYLPQISTKHFLDNISVVASWKNEKDWLLIPEIARLSFRIASQKWSVRIFCSNILNFQHSLIFFGFFGRKLNYDRSSEEFTATFFRYQSFVLHWPIFSIFSMLRWTSTNNTCRALEGSLPTGLITATTLMEPVLKSKDFALQRVWLWRKTWWDDERTLVRSTFYKED